MTDKRSPAAQWLDCKRATCVALTRGCDCPVMQQPVAEVLKRLPGVYVLELACDGCDCPDTVITAPDAGTAWVIARGAGWLTLIDRIYCPTCASHPLVHS